MLPAIALTGVASSSQWCHVRHFCRSNDVLSAATWDDGTRVVDVNQLTPTVSRSNLLVTAQVRID